MSSKSIKNQNSCGGNMGRKNATGRVPQRSRLIPNREERRSRTSHAFSIYRPVVGEASDTIYERMKLLQDEQDIPSILKLFSGRMHCSIVQEERVRKGLAKGLAAGFVIGSALSHIENGLPNKGRGCVEARFTGVDVIGRNRNILIGHVRDEDGKLQRSRLITKKILSDMGLKINIDCSDHITLGVSQHKGLTQTERRHVMHTAFEVIADIPVSLDPVVVEHNNVVTPLSEFSALGK